MGLSLMDRSIGFIGFAVKMYSMAIQMTQCDIKFASRIKNTTLVLPLHSNYFHRTQESTEYTVPTHTQACIRLQPWTSYLVAWLQVRKVLASHQGDPGSIPGRGHM